MATAITSTWTTEPEARAGKGRAPGPGADPRRRRIVGSGHAYSQRWPNPRPTYRLGLRAQPADDHWRMHRHGPIRLLGRGREAHDAGRAPAVDRSPRGVHNLWMEQKHPP